MGSRVIALIQLLLLPLYIGKLFIQHFTTGTVFQDDQTKRSLRRVLYAGTVKYTLKCLSLQLFTRHLYSKADELVLKLIPKINNESCLPNYGQFFTQNDGDWEAPDSFWIGRTSNLKSDDPVLVYIHGGYFGMHILETQIEALANIFKVLNRKFLNLGVLFVDYLRNLDSTHYSTQIHECTYVYQKLIAENYTNISLIGDSVGANMILSLLKSINSTPISIYPNSVILVSAWLDLANAQNAKSSIEANDELDIFSFETVKKFCKENKPKPYNDENEQSENIYCNLDTFDWSSIPPIQEGRILSVVGQHEILLSQNLNWCQKAKITYRFPQNVVIIPKGFHLSFFISETVDYGCLDVWEQQPAAKAIVTFLQNQL